MAQTQDSTSIIQDGWIEKMSDKIAMDLSLNNAYEVFEVRTPNQKTVIHLNAATNLRFNLNYRFLSVGFSMEPNFIPGNGDEDLKGETKSFGLRAFYNLLDIKVFLFLKIW